MPRTVAQYSTAHDILRRLVSPGIPATAEDRVLGTASRLVYTRPRAQTTPYAIATALYFADNPDMEHLDGLSEESVASAIYGNPAFDKYLSEADDLLEDAPVNAAGTGAVAGLLGDPPVKPRKKRR